MYWQGDSRQRAPAFTKEIRGPTLEGIYILQFPLNKQFYNMCSQSWIFYVFKLKFTSSFELVLRTLDASENNGSTLKTFEDLKVYQTLKFKSCT